MFLIQFVSGQLYPGKNQNNTAGPKMTKESIGELHLVWVNIGSRHRGFYVAPTVLHFFRVLRVISQQNLDPADRLKRYPP